MDKPRFQIGQHIREHVLPIGITVTDAAKRLGVGRPALSNLLNGNAALSEEMALRLERTFGANRDALLKLHRSQQQPLREKKARDVEARGHVRSFLSIKAREIEQWADQEAARQLLPVLLRKLIHETGRDLTRVDFPGFDNSQRSGWDGVVESRTAMAWIPVGTSWWEFGTDQRPRRKAESDYAKRVSLPPQDRMGCTFIFVTPRNWPGKGKWVQEKEASSDGWQAVRAYDASDLEQWLEEALATPLWFAEQCLGSPVEGIQTLDRYWRDWSQVSDPPMSRRIFEPNVKTSLRTFEQWLNVPPDRPFVVASDSIGETLAFVTCLFEAAQEFETEADSLRWEAKRNLAAVFESQETLQRLAKSAQPFIPIVGNAEVEEALAPFWNRRHCIVHSPRNTALTQHDVALELISLEDVHEALDDMGVLEGDWERLERESGRSPTILRRRLSKFPRVGMPPWSTDAGHARELISMALVGAWRTDREADKEILATLADRPYEDLEKAITDLLALDDCPLWSIGNHRGIASKMDALYAVASRMTPKEVDDFLVLAEFVLSESDPALELPQDQRWAAAIYDKLRDHSGELREGVCETVVMLAVHAGGLFGQRLDIDVKGKVQELVRRVLDPLTSETLESQENDLPAYAEAAPDILLELLEGDLAKDEPAVLTLMRPVGSAPFEHCPRTGLLWALECMAWNPAYVARTCVVLAKLAQIPIRDNWANTPAGSLGGILRSWMPQTGASIEQRVDVLRMLVRCFPDVAWDMCIGEIGRGPRFAMDAYRPRWNGDATGAGGTASTDETLAFIEEAWRLLMLWRHDVSKLGDLVAQVQELDEERQLAVWRLVDEWVEADPNDEDRATLRERIRRRCLTRRGHQDQHETVKRARNAFDKLLPTDPVNRHAWLFANGWVDESWDEIEDDADDWEAREARIDAQRRVAIDDVWSAGKLEGVLALVDRGNAAATVGRYVGLHDAIDDDSAAEVLRACLHDESRDESVLDAFMRGLIGSATDPAQSDLLLWLGNQIAEPDAVRLFRCAPFHASTWRLIDRMPAEVCRAYWQSVSPTGWVQDEPECDEVILHLLEVGRPRAALAAVGFQLHKVDPTRLAGLLAHVASGSDEPSDEQCLFAPHTISDAFEAVHASPLVSLEEKARLEFAFIGALERSKHGIPNLEGIVAQSPQLFVEAVVRCYRRQDGQSDPDGWSVDERRGKALASASRQLLRSIKRIPGTQNAGEIDQPHLIRWIHEARRQCSEFGRTGVGDLQIGELLSRALPDDSGNWPCTPVCEALEATPSADIAQGFIIGKRNARGVTVGDRAPQDQELAGNFRRWSTHRRTDFPFVGNTLLRLAESYDRDAEMWKRQAMVDKRLGQ